MTKEEFVTNNTTLVSEIYQLSEGGIKNLSKGDKERLNDLRLKKELLHAEFIHNFKPCDFDDKFQTTSYGGRLVKGVCKDFFIRNGEVYIESYYPVVNGVKKSQIAYFSMPHGEIKIL